MALVVGMVALAGSAVGQSTAELDEDSLPLSAAEQQVLRGETSLSEGTQVTVRIVSEDSGNPFLRREEAIVDSNGTFATVFDMSRVPANATYELTVRHDSEKLLQRNERVVACERNCTDPVPDRLSTVHSQSPSETYTEVEQGAVAAVPVTFGDSNVTTFSIGGPSVNYRHNVTVTDGNGDGRATLQFNTSNAGTDRQTIHAVDANSTVTVVEEEPDLASTLDPASYNYRYYHGHSTSGAPETTGVVRIVNGTDREYEVSNNQSFGFKQAIVRVRQGNTATLEISTSDAATVSIGGPSSGYEINATVRDGNGDGSVTLQFDTDTAGRDGQTLSTVDPADEVVVEPGSEVALDTRLDAGNYDLSLYRGTEVDSHPDEIGTLIVTDGADASTTTGSTSTGAIPDGSATNNPGGSFGSGIGLLGVGGLLAVIGVTVVLRGL